MVDMIENQLLLQLTTQIVVAHVSHNSVPADMLPTLIHDVYQSLGGVETQENEAEVPPEPAVNPKKSVFNDYIICLEDGKKLKMLRRHLKSSFNMTPEQYRQRWQLPAEYPMVAPAYAATRSALAKKIGLGTKAVPEAAPSPAAAALRKKKAA